MISDKKVFFFFLIFLYIDMYIIQLLQVASMVQLDARPTGNQEVVGSTGSATFCRGDSIMKYFYRHSFSSVDSRWAVVSFWQMCTILVHRIEE